MEAERQIEAPSYGRSSERPAGRLAELYVRHATDARRLAYLLTGDRSLAEDLAQEAFVRVAGRLTFLRTEDAMWPYLRRCIVNLSKNHFRHRAIERAYLASTAPPAQTPSEDMDAAERGSMQDALLSLPSRQRAAIVLRYYEDLSEDRIAEILQCRPGTARSLISRGLQTLRTSAEVTIDG